MRRVRVLLLVLFSTVVLARAQWSHQSSQPNVGLAPDEHVVFFRSYAHPIEGGKRWDLEITGHIWKGNRSWIEATGTSWVKAFLAKGGIFFVKDVRGQRLEIQVGGFGVSHTTPPPAGSRHYSVSLTSDEHGEFIGHVQLSHEDVLGLSEQKGQLNWHITYGLVGSQDKDSRGRVYLDKESGISVVSDIDDTIKDTHVWSPVAVVFRSLFPSKAIAGMSHLFSDWSLQSRACFHYISSGPDQMEKAMERFLDSSGFPEGSVDLQAVSFKDPKTTREWRRGNPCRYKIVKITKILEDFPDRRFCLIGDAGEGDKRALLWLAKQYPDRVKWVFIRHLPRNIKEDFVDPKRYADDARCTNSNPPVPRTVYYKEFYSPAELARLLPIAATSKGVNED